MERRPCAARRELATFDSQAGVTLTEVLGALLVLALGMASLAELFRLGAQSFAEEIHDERTAAIASNAATLADDANARFSDMAHFVEVSLLTGSVDPAAAAELREKYEDLDRQADDLERRLEELRREFPPDVIQPRLGPLLGQIRRIRGRIRPITHLLATVEHLAVGPPGPW